MEGTYRGAVMIAATSMLRPPPARISKVTDNIILPRSITLVSLLAGIAGAVVGAMFLFTVLIWIIPVNLTVAGVVVGAGAAAGVFTVTWSPIKGESLFKWLGLNAARLRRDRVEINGQPVRAYIGIAPLHRTAVGRVYLCGSAVEVPPGSVDDRGVLLTGIERTRSAAESLGLSAVSPFPGPTVEAFPEGSSAPAQAYDDALAQSTWGWTGPQGESPKMLPKE